MGLCGHISAGRCVAPVTCSSCSQDTAAALSKSSPAATSLGVLFEPWHQQVSPQEVPQVVDPQLVLKPVCGLHVGAGHHTWGVVGWWEGGSTGAGADTARHSTVR